MQHDERQRQCGLALKRTAGGERVKKEKRKRAVRGGTALYAIQTGAT